MNLSVTIPFLLYSIIVVFICMIVIRWSLNIRTKFIKQKNDIIYASNKPQLVIAHYKEDLDWMNNFDLFPFDVTIYMKYHKELVTNDYRCISLPNIGRCDHTYIYHIVENYDNLANIILFTPCGLSDIPIKLNKFKFIYNNYAKATTYGIVSDGLIKSYLYDFTLDNWKSITPNNQNKETYDYSTCPTCLVPASIRPYGKWAKTFLNLDIVRGVNYTWCANGIFAVSKESILRYPKAFYERILQELSTGDNIEAGHYVERSYIQLFAK